MISLGDLGKKGGGDSKGIYFLTKNPHLKEFLSGLVGLLFWVLRPFQTVFQSISGRLPERGREGRERTEELFGWLFWV